MAASLLSGGGLLLQKALEEGTWKKQPEQPGKGKVALGSSCPRF